MTMAAISLLPKTMPTASDGAGGATPDGAAGFAAMMAGVGQPAAGSNAAPADDTKNTDPIRDLTDSLRGTDKDREDQPSDDGTTSTMALLGLPVLPSVPNAKPVDVEVAASGTQAAGSGPMAPAVGAAPPCSRDLPPSPRDLPPTPRNLPPTPRDLPPTGEDAAAPQSTTGSGAATLAQVLTALTDTLGKGAAVGSPPTGSALPSTPPRTAVEPTNPLSVLVPPEPRTDGSISTTSAQPMTAPAVEPARNVATVADAAPQVAAPAAPPPPATTAVLAARVMPTLSRTEAKATAGNARPVPHRTDEAVEASADASAGAAPTSPIATPHASRDGVAASPPAMAIDDAGQALATSAADRQLDLARQGAWLDGIAHDIAATGASSGTVRFQVAPQHLGTVAVELKRDESGAAITLTTNSEAARAMLSDATPQLIAEARTHGLTIANAKVDVGSGNAGSGGNASTDSQARAPGEQSSGHHGKAQDSSFSAQTGTGSETGRQSQTRSQPMPEYRSGMTRMDRGSAGEAKASVATPSTRRPDARYA